MKKILVLFMFVFGVACSAMAKADSLNLDKWANVSFPYDSQANKVLSDPDVLVRDGSMVMIIHFDNDVAAKEPEKYKQWADFLTDIQEHIGSVTVSGAADAKRADGKSEKNITLSQNRAEWVIDNILPDAIAKECSLDGIWSEKCIVRAEGDASDLAFSNGARDANANERAARIEIIWRLPQCEQKTIANVTKIKNLLIDIRPKYSQNAEKNSAIVKALGIIQDIEAICSSAGQPLLATDAEQHAWLLSELAALISSELISIPEIKQVSEVWTSIEWRVETNNIDTYYYNLAKIRDKLKRNVWRDADGNFNTARLVSDSVAGVVLGTVGGIVTSKLVKKNQLKKGFEDLSCNVGGQKISDYGDSFQVGIQ